MKIHVDNEFSLRTAIFPSSLYYFSMHAAIRRVYCCMLIMLRMCARMKGKFYRYILLLSIGYMKALLYAQRVIIYARYVYKFHLAKLDMGLINYYQSYILALPPTLCIHYILFRSLDSSALCHMTVLTTLLSSTITVYCYLNQAALPTSLPVTTTIL